MRFLSSLRNTMGLKSLRLSSLIIVFIFLIIRFFSTPLWPLDLAIQTEDKNYLLQAGEDWVIYFKHAEARHPFLAAENITRITLENETMGMELSLKELKSETLFDQTQVTIMTLIHPFQSTLVPLTLEKPKLSFYMLDGSKLSFELAWFGIFPEKEHFHALPFSELFGLYTSDRLGLQGFYITLENPISLKRCIRRIDVGFKTISPDQIYQTQKEFIPHQSINGYDKGFFEGCIHPYETVRLLVEWRINSVLETLPISLEFEDGSIAYLEPVRLVRNIPFHHEMPLIEGQFHD
jgi:hypothetical protein